jgi:hypothetical protein
MGKVLGAALIGGPLAGLAFLTFVPSVPAAAEQSGATRAETAAKAVPRASWDGKPDLTGVWQGAGLNARAYGLAELERVYQPSAKEKMKALTENDDPNRPHIYRYIPTDGRKHTEDVFPTYQGDSVGRWDGDTLVVDVTSFNGKIWLGGIEDRPTPNSSGGWMTSDALHLVERWRLLDANTLEYQATVDDPKVLTGPWTTPKIVLKRLPIRKLEEEGHCIPADIDWVSPASR